MNTKRYTSGQVLHLFNGEIGTVNEAEEYAICQALSMLPATMVDDIAENVWFISMAGLDGLRVTLEGIRAKAMIILSQSFNDLTEEEQVKVVLHEVGHYIDRSPLGESAAEEFVDKYYMK